jgi:hypothetical protein
LQTAVVSGRHRLWCAAVRLEKHDVEDVVELGTLRKLKTKGHLPDAL